MVLISVWYADMAALRWTGVGQGQGGDAPLHLLQVLLRLPQGRFIGMIDVLWYSRKDLMVPHAHI